MRALITTIMLIALAFAAMPPPASANTEKFYSDVSNVQYVAATVAGMNIAVPAQTGETAMSTPSIDVDLTCIAAGIDSDNNNVMIVVATATEGAQAMSTVNEKLMIEKCPVTVRAMTTNTDNLATIAATGRVSNQRPC